MPFQRTLQDYTYVIETTAGFSANVDQQIMEAANIHECNIIDKYMILIMDEIHIEEGIVYDKNLGEKIHSKCQC